MVDIRTLWNNGMFQGLTSDAKLVYVYLSSNPSLTTVGVVCLNPDTAATILSLTPNEFKNAVQDLVNKKYIFVKAYDGLIYFIVPRHFSTLSTNDNTIEKIKSDLAGLPTKLKKFLDDIGISAEKKYKRFEKPTLLEIEKVGMGFGYAIDAKAFFDYYEDMSKSQGKQVFWVDSYGKQIKDWKMKLKRVWCKPQNKLQQRKGAPEGYDYFFVQIDNKYFFPDSWKDGQPRSKDYSLQRALQKKYNEQRAKTG